MRVILNDSVMHYHDLARAVPVRVSVGFAWPPVRGPARMTDSVAAIQRAQVNCSLKIAESANCPADLHPVAVARDRYSCRVVDSVLQPAKAFKDDRGCRFFGSGSSSAGHKNSLGWLTGDLRLVIWERLRRPALGGSSCLRRSQ